MDNINAEEAQRALDLAKKALEAGNNAKAISLLQKSIRMRKTAEAESLLGVATRATARQQAKDAPTESAAPARAHTEEQAKGVKTILRAKTHYEVLSIEATADDSAIKKAYRRMALQFHPDKNAAPGADEAFKKISKAFAVLNDPQARAHYDRYGDTDRAVAQGGGGGFNGNHMYQEVDPDEIFRMFFGAGLNGGGGFGGPGIRFHQFNMGGQRQRRHQQHQVQPEVSSLMWALAMFFIFVSLFWGGSGPAEMPRPPYAFQASGALQVPKTTSGLNGLVRGIPYYVNQQFGVWARLPENLYRFEAHVQEHYLPHLTQQCRKEKDEKNRAVAYARTQEAKDAAAQRETPSCTKMDEFKRVLQGR